MSKTGSEIVLTGVKVNRNSKIPLYQQLYEQFRIMILNKRPRTGNRLPSTIVLADQIGVSRMVLTQSFEQLIAEGYLIGKTGSGTFVAEKIPDYLTLAKGTDDTSPIYGKRSFDHGKEHLPKEILARNSNKEEVAPFQTGSPSFDAFPYKIWQQVGNKVLKKFKSFNLGYDDALGYMPLRQEIATYLRQARAVKCETGQVIVVSGSQQGLNLVTDCLLRKGDTVWMEDPGYHGAKFSFLNKGVKIHPVPIEKDV